MFLLIIFMLYSIIYAYTKSESSYLVELMATIQTIFICILFHFLLPIAASSVAVSAWTLVAISLERYYAICDPLRSRRWQTLKHAYKLIALIWCASFAFMSPIAVLSRLIPTSQGEIIFSRFLFNTLNVDWPGIQSVFLLLKLIIDDWNGKCVLFMIYVIP